ncbi:D-inositol-3-phosphate glycosyltransferase [compost metagenome]
MEILILTSIWTGARPFFYEGKVVSKGMPAFNNVFLRLLEDKRVTKIHFMVWDPSGELKKPEIYKDKLVYYPITFKWSFLSGFQMAVKSLFKGISIVRKNKSIKRIIGYGGLAGITAIIGQIFRIPDFRRIYGTFLISEINEPKWKLFVRHPLEYLSFAMKGKALLITNDGTKGDVVYNKIGSSKLPLHFLLNGIDKDLANNCKKPDFPFQENCLSYVARLDPWKRQHLFIEALALLKKNGLQIPKAYIIGAEPDPSYAAFIRKIISDNDLDEDIEIISGIPIQEVHYVIKHSIITFSLYDVSNLGNVFIEALQLGTPTVAINDTGSLDLIDRAAFFELKDAEVKTVAESIRKLLNDKQKRQELREGALNFANSTFLSWDERAKIEIDMILN